MSQAFAGTKKAGSASTETASGTKHDVDAGIALKLRGLPYQVTLDDIKTFFSSYNVQESSIKVGLQPDGRKTGEGAVLFKTEEDCKSAFKEK